MDQTMNDLQTFQTWIVLLESLKSIYILRFFKFFSIQLTDVLVSFWLVLQN